MKLDDKSFDRHRRAQVTLLAAGFAPEADANGYRIMCDFMEWVFYFDDLFDEGSLREDPRAARDEVEAHLRIHNGHLDISPEDHPVRFMYQVLWKEIQAISSLGAQARYVQSMRHYFEGCVAQVDAYHWRTRGYAATTLDMFLRGRTHSVGCRPCQALLEYVAHGTSRVTLTGIDRPLYNLELPDTVAWQSMHAVSQCTPNTETPHNSTTPISANMGSIEAALAAIESLEPGESINYTAIAKSMVLSALRSPGGTGL